MEEVLYRKIRILSFQNAHNFGAVLQAYGLQQTILSMGFKDVKFLNYNPKYLSDRYNPFVKSRVLCVPKSIKGIVIWLPNTLAYIISSLKRNRKFCKSIHRMLVQTEEQITDIEELQRESVDVLICGSDQIWNTALTGDFDPVFLGQGPYKKIDYAISYAPSTEVSAFKEDDAIRLSAHLSLFKYLSVREDYVKDLLSKHVAQNIKVCVDPTILCGRERFDKIAAKRQVRKDYILIYAYDPFDKDICAVVNSIPNSEEYEKHIILLSADNWKTFFSSNVHSDIYVEDFLSYFKYASYIVTNSFHGLAFSLLFERNFNVVFCKDKYIRCLSLLEQLGMTCRFVRNGDECTWEYIDYLKVNKNISSLRDDSYDFLLKSLRGCD